MSPRPLPIIPFLATFCLMAAGVGSATATQFSWYGNGTNPGGNGTWDTTSLDWSASGSSFTSWSNSGSNGAIFGDGPGVVVVDTAITAGNLTFNDTGFVLNSDSSNAITLTGSASVYVANGSQAWIELPLAGSAGMTLSGGGELLLTSTNANTYSGTTKVSGSFLLLDSSSALPSGNLVIDGGVIELAAGNFTLGAGSGSSQVQFTANGGGFAAVGANYIVNLGSVSTTMTWGSTYFLPSSGTTSATLVLGSHQATGTVNFENPINLGSAVRTVQVNEGQGTVTVDAILSGVLSGSGGLVMTGEGTLALTASNTYSGGTTVSDGILSIQNASALGSGGVTLNGGTLQLAATLSGSTTVSLAEDSWIDVTGVTAGTLGNLGIAGNTLYVTGGGTAANTAYSLTLGKGTLSGNPTFNVSNNGTGIGTLTLGALFDSGTARTLTKAGSGVLILGTSATSLVQGTTVNITGGTLKSNNATALGNFARVTISSGGQFNLGAGQQISSLAGSGSVALGGNLLTIGNSDNQSSTFSGVITGSGSLAKQGSGMLTLSGSDTYSGDTTVSISGGTLKSSNSTALGSFARVTISSGAQFNLGGSQQISSLAGSGSVALGGFVLTVGNSDNQSGTYSGVISGSGGSLVKQGSGTLILSGSDTYSGGTTVDAGVLYAMGSSAIPTRTRLTVGASGTVVFGYAIIGAPTATPSVAESPGAVVAAVPEPSTSVLTAIGAIVLLGCAWRRLRILRT